MSLASALTYALTGSDEPLPTDAGELVGYAGGRSELARGIAGVGDERPRDMSPEDRRRYNSAMRQVQRWLTGAGEKRRLRPEALERQRTSLLRRKNPKLAAMRRRGARMRLRAWVKIPSPKKGVVDRRFRDMPAGAAGQLIPDGSVATVLDLFEEGETEQAAEALLEAFAVEYGFAQLVEGLEDSEEVDLKLWPDGDREPEDRG